MSVLVYITIEHPRTGRLRTVPARGVSMPKCGRGANRTLSFHIYDQVNLWKDQGNASNTLCEGSIIRLYWNSETPFIGEALDISDARSSSGQLALKVSCADKGNRLRTALAVHNGQYMYKREAPIAELSGIPLELLSGAEGFESCNRFPVFPAASTMVDTHDETSPWVGKDKARTTTLTDGIADDTTTDPIAVDDVTQLSFPCFLQVEDELIYCSRGYYDADAEQGYADGIVRGALGSTAAAHSPAEDCYQRQLKPICDANAIELTYGSGDVIGREFYHPRPTAGRFDFNTQFSPYSSSTEGAYSVFDLDDAAGLSVAGIVSDWLEASGSLGAPGLSAGDYSVAGMDEILRTALNHDNMGGNLWDDIQQLLTEAWTYGPADAARHRFDFLSLQGKFVLQSCRQKTTADRVFKHVAERTVTTSLGQLWSGVLVSYDVTEPMNLIDYTDGYHLAIGDDNSNMTPGATPNSLVTAVMYQQMERAFAAGWQESSIPGHNVFTNYLHDGDENTGWGLRFNENFWLSTEPNTRVYVVPLAGGVAAQMVDFVNFIADLRNVVATYFEAEVVGFDSYTPGDPPTLGNEIPLGIRVAWRNSVYGMQPAKQRHWWTNRGSGSPVL